MVILQEFIPFVISTVLLKYSGYKRYFSILMSFLSIIDVTIVELHISTWRIMKETF